MSEQKPKYGGKVGNLVDRIDKARSAARALVRAADDLQAALYDHEKARRAREKSAKK